MQPEPHPSSYYAASVDLPEPLASLKGSQRVDVCVIGGGFTGLSAAIELSRAGRSVALIEANRIGWGASGRNGGQLSPSIGNGMNAVIKSAGVEAAKKVWPMTEQAVDLVLQRIDRYAINCDIKPGILEAAVQASHMPNLLAEADLMANTFRSDDSRIMTRDQVAQALGTRRYHGGILAQRAYHLHPLKLVLGMARAAQQEGAQLFEGSRALDIEKKADGFHVRTAAGVVQAGDVLLACNGYLDELDRQARAKIMPCANFILATEPLDDALNVIPSDVAVYDTNFVLDYYRKSAEGRLLFGGLVSYSTRPPIGLKNLIHKRMCKTFPQLKDARSDFLWAGILAITYNRMPCLGRTDQGVYYAQGYSGHGLALSSLFGKLAGEAMMGAQNRFDIFANLPVPNFPGGRVFRQPLLMMATMYQRLRDLI